MELIKFLIVCLKKLGERFNIGNLEGNVIADNEHFNQISNALINLIKRNELDLNFRKYLVGNFAGFLKKTQADLKIPKVQVILLSMIEVDNTEI